MHHVVVSQKQELGDFGDIEFASITSVICAQKYGTQRNIAFISKSRLGHHENIEH
jgi:hypothetical protein